MENFTELRNVIKFLLLADDYSKSSTNPWAQIPFQMAWKHFFFSQLKYFNLCLVKLD